jgi:hypothetical protein
MTDTYPTLDDLDPANPKVYGRIEDDAIAEYPVYDYHIVNRAHPFDWYTPVVYKKRPDVPPYHYVQEIPAIAADGQSIVVSYSAPIAFGLESLFSAIPGNEHSFQPPWMPFPESEEPKEPLVVPDDLKPRLINAIKDRVQQRLDQFARGRDYDGILSAVSYELSDNKERQAEANYCRIARDATWDALYQLQADVEAGTTPFPRNWYEIEQQLPALQWPDTTTGTPA